MTTNEEPLMWLRALILVLQYETNVTAVKYTGSQFEVYLEDIDAGISIDVPCTNGIPVEFMSICDLID